MLLSHWWSFFLIFFSSGVLHVPTDRCNNGLFPEGLRQEFSLQMCHPVRWCAEHWIWNIDLTRKGLTLIWFFLCACVFTGCMLNEENFSVRCPEHKVNTPAEQPPGVPVVPWKLKRAASHWYSQQHLKPASCRFTLPFLTHCSVFLLVSGRTNRWQAGSTRDDECRACGRYKFEVKIKHLTSSHWFSLVNVFFHRKWNHAHLLNVLNLKMCCFVGARGVKMRFVADMWRELSKIHKIVDGSFVVFLPDESTDLLRVWHVLPYFTAAVL